MKNKRSIIIITVIVVLLFVPLIAMQLTNEIDWKGHDFIVMAVLLSGAGLLTELAWRKLKNITQKTLACGLILIIFFAVWAELAVGLL